MNNFDRVYNKLNLLHEDFKTQQEVKDFFGIALIDLVEQLMKALPNTSWELVPPVYDPEIINDPKTGGQTITALAAIQCLTTDFDIQKDFDFDHPIKHQGWEEYRLRKMSQTLLDLINYMCDFKNHGINLGKYISENSELVIKISNISFLKEPYAFKYLNSPNNPIKVSKFAHELLVKFTVSLAYSVSNEDTATNITPKDNIATFLTKMSAKVQAEHNDKPSLKLTPVEEKLSKALAGIEWKATFKRGGMPDTLKGVGYTEDLSNRLRHPYITVATFDIVDDDI